MIFHFTIEIDNLSDGNFEDGIFHFMIEIDNPSDGNFEDDFFHDFYLSIRLYHGIHHL